MKQEVLVLDNRGCFLSYTHPATARKLLKDGEAVIYAKDPFAIKLNKQVETSHHLHRNEPNMSQVTNFTKFFTTERDIFVQNISNCQVSVQFDVGPGHSESYLFVNSRDPVNLTQKIPFAAIKSSMDFRRMLNRVPPALHLMEDDEYTAFYDKSAATQGLASAAAAMEKAEMKRATIQSHVPLNDAPKPLKVTEDHEDSPEGVVVNEQDIINPRILNLCLQVHQSLEDQLKMSAQNFLSELDSISDLTLLDWEYVQSHGYYKSVRNLARKKVADLASAPTAEEVEDAKPKVKAKKTKVAPTT